MSIHRHAVKAQLSVIPLYRSVIKAQLSYSSTAPLLMKQLFVTILYRPAVTCQSTLLPCYYNTTLDTTETYSY